MGFSQIRGKALGKSENLFLFLQWLPKIYIPKSSKQWIACMTATFDSAVVASQTSTKVVTLYRIAWEGFQHRQYPVSISVAYFPLQILSSLPSDNISRQPN